MSWTDPRTADKLRELMLEAVLRPCSDLDCELCGDLDEEGDDGEA